MPSRSTDQLVRASLSGDTEAYRAIVREFGPGVRAWLARQVWDAHVVNDLAQETFIAAWDALPRFEIEGSLGAWLTGIARNRLRNYLRSKRRRDAAMERAREQLLVLLEPDQAESDIEARRAALQVCIEKLPERSRTVVQERYREGQEIDDLASSQGMKANALRQLLFRIRQRLRSCILEEFRWESTIQVES